MKYTRRSVALCLAVAATAMACKTDLTGLNVNPNSPTSAPASTLFTQASINAVGRFVGSGQLSGTALFAQHLAQVQYVEEDRGRLRTETIDGWFTNSYVSELEDYQKVIEQGDANKSANTSGPARVMQSWVFQNMSDMWGDIPYTEALQADKGGPLKPKYDTQKDIYYGLLKTLTEASASMKAGTTDAGLGAADPIYKGDMSNWLRFSNGMRLRLALRMQKADASKAAAEMSAAIAAPGGLMTTNAHNATLAWPGDGVYDNPYSGTFSTRDDHRVSKTLLDTMIALGDPRVKIYAQPTKADPTIYAGLQNGLDNATVTPFFNTTSRVGTIFYPGSTTYGTFGSTAGKKTPSVLMTAAEMEFILAEMVERGFAGASGTAKSHYDAGVTLSITQWGGTAAEAATYLAKAGVTYVPGATGVKQIGLQKWLSMFTQGTEAWSEFRRTGNPVTIKMGPKAYPDVPEIPRRILYPSNEQTVNADALNAAIARQGANTYITRIWWDK
ncbi:MAG: SusD/RagB family nutrient-binding outer membrane lipoprotein [Gemmatimonadota bacterium]